MQTSRAKFAVRSDWRYIKYFEVPDHIAKEVISDNPDAFKLIDNPSDSVILFAVRKDPELIEDADLGYCGERILDNIVNAVYSNKDYTLKLLRQIYKEKWCLQNV